MSRDQKYAGDAGKDTENFPENRPFPRRDTAGDQHDNHRKILQHRGRPGICLRDRRRISILRKHQTTDAEGHAVAKILRRMCKFMKFFSFRQKPETDQDDSRKDEADLCQPDGVNPLNRAEVLGTGSGNSPAGGTRYGNKDSLCIFCHFTYSSLKHTPHCVLANISVSAKQPQYTLLSKFRLCAIKNYSSTDTISSPSSFNCFSSTVFGASVIRQDASFIFGNAITSRMDSAPTISITIRSRPYARPA